jgi:hypothetical protein
LFKFYEDLEPFPQGYLHHPIGTCGVPAHPQDSAIFFQQSLSDRMEDPTERLIPDP